MAANARRVMAACLGDPVAVEFPRSGDQRMIADFGEMEPAQAKPLARELSRRLPELWLTLDNEVYLRDGVVYQRSGRYNLELVRGSRMRLRRAVRFGFLEEVDRAVARFGHRAPQDETAQ